MTATALGQRLDFSRLFGDAGKVMVRAWPVLIISMPVIGAPTVIATSIPWWQGPAAEYLRAWVRVTTEKSLVSLVGFSLLSACVATVSLNILDKADVQRRVVYSTLVCGFPTSLAANLSINLVRIASPFVVEKAPTHAVQWTLAILAIAVALPVAVFCLLAVPAAAAEQRFVLAAFTRSARISRGLRWRLLVIYVGYLVIVGAASVAIATGLSLTGIRLDYEFRAAVGSALTMLVSVPAQVVFTSAFLQARRIADGPSAAELVEVFA